MLWRGQRGARQREARRELSAVVGLVEVVGVDMESSEGVVRVVEVVEVGMESPEGLRQEGLPRE